MHLSCPQCRQLLRLDGIKKGLDLVWCQVCQADVSLPHSVDASEPVGKFWLESDRYFYFFPFKIRRKNSNSDISISQPTFWFHWAYFFLGITFMGIETYLQHIFTLGPPIFLSQIFVILPMWSILAFLFWVFKYRLTIQVREKVLINEKWFRKRMDVHFNPDEIWWVYLEARKPTWFLPQKFDIVLACKMPFRFGSGLSRESQHLIVNNLNFLLRQRAKSKVVDNDRILQPITDGKSNKQMNETPNDHSLRNDEENQIL